jgi:ABC-type bacteriocin/lantibiotic exporter with double-glycine peptidase domain
MIKTPWKRLSELLKLEKREVSQLYIYAIFTGILGLSLPLGIQAVIHFIQAGQISTSWVLLILFVIGGVILSGTLQIMQLRITENLQQRIFARYSFDLAYRFPRFKRSMVNDKEPTELMNRFFDVISLQKGLAKVLLDFTSSSLQIAFSLIVLSFYHPFYIAFSLLLVFTLYLVFRPMIRAGFKTSMEESGHKYRAAYWLQEVARADWSFRLTPKGNLPLKRLDEHAQNYLTAREEHFKILWKQYFWMVSIKAVIVAALLGLGGYLVIDQQMNLGQFVAAEVLILLLLASVEKLIQLLESLYDVFTSLEKLGQVIDIPLAFDQAESLNYSENRSIFPIELQHKTKHEECILKIEKGDRIILRGTETIYTTHILRQLIDTSMETDTVLLWNKTIPDSQKIIHTFDCTGWFEKGSQLVRGTLMENIIMGRDYIKEEQLNLAVHTTGLVDFIEKEKYGYNFEIFQQYGQFTEEVKEKILITRALVHEPQFLLLSFDQLSMETDKLSDMLSRISENYPNTTIVCASEHITLPNWTIKTL